MEISETNKGSVITYGTFDLFHVGHLRLLRRAKGFGNSLHVGVSSDEFNKKKGKETVIGFEERVEIISSLSFVDTVFAEHSWEQKEQDIRRLNAQVFVMGDDWQGKFDHLSNLCEVKYIPRTEIISTTLLKEQISVISSENLSNIRNLVTKLSSILDTIQE